MPADITIDMANARSSVNTAKVRNTTTVYHFLYENKEYVRILLHMKNMYIIIIYIFKQIAIT